MNTEECLICQAPLEYLTEGEVMECAICHKKEPSKTRCVKGHYVCGDCHTQGMDSILGLCLSETSADPVAILQRMMALPFCHMHGPEHHVLVGAALQIGTYAAPMLAAFLLIPVLDEYGPKYALLLYATVSILSVLLVPELELAFFYVFVIGYYPVLRQQLARIKSTLLRWVIKFAVFNGATVLVYLLLFALLGPAILDELLADGVGMLAALLAAGNLSFWLCDRAVGALTRYYRLILKKKLKFLH